MCSSCILHYYSACAQTGSCMILSSWSNTSVEDVAEAMQSLEQDGCSMGLRWFQLQAFSNETLTSQLIQRAEKNGYKALVVTVDTPILGRRLAALKSGFDLPHHLRLPNLLLSGKASSNSQVQSQGPGLHQYTRELIDPGFDWNKLDWLCSQTSLPVILKGILTREDAREALRHRGVRGIVVSNHGARQLDGVPATVRHMVFYVIALVTNLARSSINFSLSLSLFFFFADRLFKF